MPRLPPRLLQHASRIDPHLAKLLPECRDLGSAQRELRWLRDHALDISKRNLRQRPNTNANLAKNTRPNGGWRKLLEVFVSQRARGKPLQYILGTQPFGDLDILCRPGVLIPRAETEWYVERLAERVRTLFERARKVQQVGGDLELTHYAGKVRVLDVCTGTGCIALLLQRRLSQGLRERVQVLGVDYSEVAVGLARRNREHNVELVVAKDIGMGQDEVQVRVDFKMADLIPPSDGNKASSRVPYIKDYLKDHAGTEGQYWDILISNPPYVSERAYNDGTTIRSVRRYEPSDALIPGMEGKTESESGDEYYPYLLDLSNHVRAKVVVLEVGDLKQAERIAELIRTNFNDYERGVNQDVSKDVIEIWKDWENDESAAWEEGVPARAVVWWRSSWPDLLKSTE